MELNEKIRKRRQELSLTLVDVANYLGVAEATVQRYESGNIKNLKSSTVTKLSEILKTTPAQLMGWDIESNPAAKEQSDIPDEFVVMARKSGKVNQEDREKLYRVLDATIDAFLMNYSKREE